MRYAFPAELTEAEDGFTITFPDVPGAISEGATRAEALDMDADALITMLAAMVDDGEAVPRSSAAEGRPVVDVAALEIEKQVRRWRRSARR